MKYLLSLLFIAASANAASGQSREEIEKQIRDLEQKGVKGIVDSDSNALKKIWDAEFIVTTPRNTIADGRSAVFQNQKAGLIDYSSFTRSIEKILIKENVVITMGTEIFVARHDLAEAKAGEPVKRRFTNIWIFENGSWQQIGRHASIICKP